MLAKIINDKIMFGTPGSGRINLDGITIINPKRETLLEHGFEDVEVPSVSDGQHIEWSIDDGRIVCSAVDDVITEQSEDELEFNEACLLFRAVCRDIEEFTGLKDFRGGFDDISLFIETPESKANPVQALILAERWNAANQLCIYIGKKIGLGQPEWWHKCWGITE